MASSNYELAAGFGEIQHFPIQGSFRSYSALSKGTYRSICPPHFGDSESCVGTASAVVDRPPLRLERDSLHHSTIPWLSNALPVGYQPLEPQECITEKGGTRCANLPCCALFAGTV